MSDIIDRAMELAKSGDYANISQIEARLRKERYSDVSAHLNGSLFRRQLRQCMRAARNP